MNRATIVLFHLALALACDPLKSSPDADAGGKSGAPAVRAEAPPGGAPAAPGQFSSLSECLSSCDQGDMIPTNRATCRLNCEGSYSLDVRGGGAPAKADDAIVQAAECLGRCQGGTDSAVACTNACKTTAAAAAKPPPADVLERLDVCIAGCHAGDDVRPTDRATCELNCTQVARVDATPPPDRTPPGT